MSSDKLTATVWPFEFSEPQAESDAVNERPKMQCRTGIAKVLCMASPYFTSPMTGYVAKGNSPLGSALVEPWSLHQKGRGEV